MLHVMGQAWIPLPITVRKTCYLKKHKHGNVELWSLNGDYFVVTNIMFCSLVGNMLQAQLMMGIRPNTAPPTNQTRFQNPMQRQGMIMPPQQRQTRPLLHQGQQQSSFEPKKSQTAQTPTTISVSSSGSSNFSSSAVSAAGSNTAGSAAFRAQQAKQRAELLAHAQSFLNPNKKPAPKKLGDAPDGVSKESAETSEEKTTSAEESKSETS